MGAARRSLVESLASLTRFLYGWHGSVEEWRLACAASQARAERGRVRARRRRYVRRLALVGFVAFAPLAWALIRLGAQG